MTIDKEETLPDRGPGSPDEAHLERVQPPLAIGEALVDMGKLSTSDVDAVLAAQGKSRLRFGEQARRMGLATASDIERALVSQYEYPYLVKREPVVSNKILAAYHPSHPLVEALRALRSQLLLKLLRSNDYKGVLTVASPLQGEGRSMLAANLAVVFSQIGMNALVLDCNLRAPVQHHFFRVPNHLGLVGILSGRAGHEEIAEVPAIAGLYVLPAGPPSPNPQELLSTPLFGKVLGRLAEKFDIVIADTPAASDYADALLVAQASGAAILMARQHKTPMSKLAALSSDLGDCGVRIGGVVLNEF